LSVRAPPPLLPSGRGVPAPPAQPFLAPAPSAPAQPFFVPAPPAPAQPFFAPAPSAPAQPFFVPAPPAPAQPFLPAFTFLPPTAIFFGPFRVRAFVLVRCPCTGRPRRCRSPR